MSSLSKSPTLSLYSAEKWPLKWVLSAKKTPQKNYNGFPSPPPTLFIMASRLSCEKDARSRAARLLYPEWLVRDSQEKGPRLRGAVCDSIWPSHLPSPICYGATHWERYFLTMCHPHVHKYSSRIRNPYQSYPLRDSRVYFFNYS